jgi:integrase
VFRYAIAREYCLSDPTFALREELQSPPCSNFASITKPADVGKLLRTIDNYKNVVVRNALKFAALVFLRPGEVRWLEWEEIGGDKIHIPPEKMKKKHPHIVPLSSQTLELLDQMRLLTGHAKYVFISSHYQSAEHPMGANALVVALRSMGYTKDQMTARGFRHMASTLLNENGWNRDWIECQLAHTKGGVRGTYNYAEYLPDRHRMMQWYADHLDELRTTPTAQ